MSHVLVTGAAGFIGMHVCRALLARGETVLGIDKLDDHYDPAFFTCIDDIVVGVLALPFSRAA